MKLKKEKKGLVFIALIVIILVALVAVISISFKQNTVTENLKQDPVIKVLFVLEDKQQVLFSDVLIYYPVSGKGVLTGIPGNTGGLHRSIDRVDRIDAVYSELGAAAYCQEISDLIDVDIPFYIDMSLKDFVEITDITGGLELFVPVPVDKESPSGEKWLLPSGRVNLDGDKIRTYLTYVFDDESDADIQSRRQDAMIEFFSAIKKNTNSLLTKENFNLIGSRMTSNVKAEDLLELFQIISKVDTERFEIISVTGILNNVDGKTLLMPFRNGEYIKDVVKKSINSIVSPSQIANDRPYVMRILNGTKVQGRAFNTQILLQGAAFEVLDIGNTEGDEEVEETYIIDHIGQPEVAKGIGEFIHCRKIVEEEIKDDDAENVSNVDFTLVLGKDFDGRWVSSPKK